jgi:hypothetical protein
MIIIKDRSQIHEGIVSNYDKAVSYSILRRILEVLEDQYKSNLKTAGDMWKADHFAYAQTYGALNAIFENLSKINSGVKSSAIRQLAASIQKFMNDVKKGVPS